MSHRIPRPTRSTESEAVRKVVITGGPCAGKSATLQHLGSTPLRRKLVTLPEVASMLLDGGYPMPGRDLAWTQEWQDGFQDCIFVVQQRMEAASCEAARQQGKPLVVMDRGLADGAAYLEGGMAAFSSRYGVEPEGIFNRYHAVIHLESLAVSSVQKYREVAAKNPARFQSIDASRDYEYRVSAAWEGHPNRTVVNDQELPDRLARVVELVNMALHPTPVPAR